MPSDRLRLNVNKLDSGNRLGLQKDMDDNRTDCFLHLIRSVLPHMIKRPDFILVENVKGFEDSHTRNVLIQTLDQLGYHVREFLLSPKQIGIPNSRLRYYLIARLTSDFSFTHLNESIIQSLSHVELDARCSKCQLIPVPELGDRYRESIQCENRSLESFLCEEVDANFFLNEKQLKYTQGMDIVQSSSCNTCCFTKGYSHLLLGSGSVLQTVQHLNPAQVLSLAQDDSGVLLQLGLRFFTPREIANLMSFPAHFRFPEHITDRQKYRLLGNSVNVQVVALMLKLMLLT